MRHPYVVPSTIAGIEAGNNAPRRADHSMGAILIEAGRLTPQDAECVARHQRERGMRFGEAATQLGLLTEADISFALAQQFDYPYLLHGESAASEELIAAYAPFGPQAEAMRALRDQLMLRWFDTDPDRKALAIISAARREGRSFIAANLAVVFSQLSLHTLLIDANMRNPYQHKLFGLDTRAGLSSVLAGHCGADAVQRIPGLANLCVLPAGTLPPNPSELLARPAFSECLRELKKQFDIILLDTPAAAHSSDAQTVTMRTGAALIVVRKNATRMWQVRAVADHPGRANATVVGTVLNEF